MEIYYNANFLPSQERYVFIRSIWKCKMCLHINMNEISKENVAILTPCVYPPVFHTFKPSAAHRCLVFFFVSVYLFQPGLLLLTPRSCCTMFMCAPRMKVLDGHPARRGVFSDKRQIVAVAAALRAVEPGYLSQRWWLKCKHNETHIGGWCWRLPTSH